jgi:hypothetical protein
MFKKVVSYAAAYLLWIITLLLGLWFLLLSRDGFLGFLSAFYIDHAIERAWQVRFGDKAFTIALGAAWLVLMIVSENSYRTGVRRGDFGARFARITGPLLLLVFAADAFLLWLQGAGNLNWLRGFILGVELIAGVALVLFARTHRIFGPTLAELDERI